MNFFITTNFLLENIVDKDIYSIKDIQTLLVIIRRSVYNRNNNKFFISVDYKLVII